MTHRFNRRPAVAGILAVLVSMALIISGCAADDRNDAGEAGALPAAEGTTAYPMTLQSPFGTTELAARPTRIAAVVPNGIDAELLLALGVTPVIASSLVNEGGYLAAHGAADLATFPFAMGEGLPVEAIAASRPDLIVAAGWTDGLGGVKLADYYERLKAIAPVLTSPDTSAQLLNPWEDTIRLIGKAVDLSAKAESVIADSEQYFATVRADNRSIEGKTATWAIYYGAASGLQYLSAPDSAPARFLKQLGFADNPLAGEFARERTVSDELISKIDADVILLGRSQAADDAAYTEFLNRPLMAHLSAVTAGRLIPLPPKVDDGDLLWAITSGGPIGHKWAANILVPKISAVL